MVDASIRPQRRKDIAGDLPFFAGALMVVGGVIGVVIVFVLDKILHRHRT